MDQLRQSVALRQPRGQRGERLPVLRNELAGALQDHPRVPKNVGHRTEVSGAQEVRNEVLEDRDQLGPHRTVALELEQVEQHRQHVAAQILRVLALDLASEVVDFPIIEEVERGVEVFDRDQPRGPGGRRLLRHVLAHLGRRHLEDGLARFDGDRVLAGQLAERVADELEVLRPEQRDQVVGSFRLEVLRLLQHAEEADDLPVFDARLERQRADAVLVQRPCDALAMGALAVDDHVLPAQLGLVDVEHQPVRDLPDLLQAGPHVVHGALVDRVVRQVEPSLADSLRQGLPELLDLRRR